MKVTTQTKIEENIVGVELEDLPDHIAGKLYEPLSNMFCSFYELIMEDVEKLGEKVDKVEGIAVVAYKEAIRAM